MGVTVAGEDGEAGIFREAGIANGKLAKKEDGAVERFDTAGMKTIVTEASTLGVMQVLLRIRHAIKDSAVKPAKRSKHERDDRGAEPPDFCVNR